MSEIRLQVACRAGRMTTFPQVNTPNGLRRIHEDHLREMIDLQTVESMPQVVFQRRRRQNLKWHKREQRLWRQIVQSQWAILDGCALHPRPSACQCPHSYVPEYLILIRIRIRSSPSTSGPGPGFKILSTSPSSH